MSLKTSIHRLERTHTFRRHVEKFVLDEESRQLALAYINRLIEHPQHAREETLQLFERRLSIRIDRTGS